MKSWVFFFVLCILAFVSSQDAVSLRSNSASSRTRSRKTPPRSTAVPTSYLTHSSHSATGLPTRSQKTPSRSTAVPKNSGKVPTSYLTHKSHSATDLPTRSQKTSPSHHTIIPKSSGKVYPTASPKTPVSTSTTSHEKPKSSISSRSFPASTKIPKSTAPPATTTRNSTGTLTVPVSASRTLTVSAGHTVSAQVGWVVVGVGTGGSIVAGGNIFHVAGGTTVIIEENSSGEDELSTIDTSTTTSTSKSSSSSKSSSTARPTSYNIYPKFGSTVPQQSAFAQDLERVAQPGSVRRITGGRNQLLLWGASLTPAQASELSRNPVVRGLNVDQPIPVNLGGASASGSPPSSPCPPENCSHQRRDGSILMQQGAVDDLKVLSQARGAPLPQLPGYAYDSRGGRGITVYLIETGINQGHPEFRNMQGNIRWLYLPDEPHIESDAIGHGTCATSKVIGPTFGVAKSANIVIMKVYPTSGSLQPSHLIAAWGIVASDIASNGLRGRAVVYAGMIINPNGISQNDRTTYIESVTDLINLDAVVVAPSGNIDDRFPGFALSTYPGLLASQLPIVVVGAVNVAGIYTPYSQGLAAELTVSAVGNVFCASPTGGVSYWEGTSFAAPSVAGLAAYLLSLDQYRERLLVPGSVARNVRDLIKSLAYARRPLQPAVVWNGIDSREIYCPVRRDAGPSGCPAQNTTLPNVPTHRKPPSKPPATARPNPPPSSTTMSTSTTTVTSSSSPLSSSIATDSSTTTVTLSSSPLSSGIATDSSTAASESLTAIKTITLGGSTETVTLSEVSVGVATNAPQALR